MQPVYLGTINAKIQLNTFVALFDPVQTNPVYSYSYSHGAPKMSELGNIELRVKTRKSSVCYRATQRFIKVLLPKTFSSKQTSDFLEKLHNIHGDSSDRTQACWLGYAPRLHL